jgi:hypothetical protein
LVLFLPAYSTIAPENGPAPETDKTSPPPEQRGRVIVSRRLYYPTSGRIIFIALNRDDNRFLTTDPPQQIDSNQVATYLLNGMRSLLISTDSQ